MRLSPWLLALLLVGCASAKSGSTKGSMVEQEQVAPTGDAKLPDFTLATVDGERFRLSDHVGQSVIIMSFWATWCAPCLEELPHLETLYQKEKDNGLMIVALSMDEPSTVAEVAPTVRRLGLTMPVVLDTEQRAVRLYNRARNAPMTVVIDRNGQIVKAHAGYNPGDEKALAEEVRGLLAAR